MGQHATIHGYDTSTPEEGKPGRWRPVKIDNTGAMVISGSTAGVITDMPGADLTADVIKTVNGAFIYERVTNVAGDTTLGVTGATGDRLERIIVSIVTAAGTITIKDNATTVLVLTALPVGNYQFDLGLVSITGPWIITFAAGASSNILAVGLFS